jgi:hypothetical protein
MVRRGELISDRKQERGIAMSLRVRAELTLRLKGRKE